MTTITLEKDHITKELRFTGSVSYADMARLKLNVWDRKLLDFCSRPGSSAEDWLLALELIFRRMNEQKIVRK